MKLGRHVLYHASSVSDAIRKVKPSSVDAVLTDCPYNVSKKGGGLRKSDYGKWDHGDGLQDVLTLLGKFNRVPNWLCFCSDLQLSHVLKAMRDQGRMTRTGVWNKSNPSVRNGEHGPLSSVELAAFGRHSNAYWGGHCEGLSWIGSGPSGKRWRLHDTQKPLGLFVAWLRLICPGGGVVLDPFAGTGTTLLAAEYLDMTHVGFEIDEAAMEAAKVRWDRRDEEFEKMEKAEAEAAV